MASATISIDAVDRSKAVFDSVKRNLRDVNKQVSVLSSGSGLGGVAARFLGVGSAIALVTQRARYLNEHFNAMQGIPDGTIRSIDVLKNQMSGVTGIIDRVILGYVEGIPSAIRLAQYHIEKFRHGEDEAATRLIRREQEATAAMARRPEVLRAQAEALNRLRESMHAAQSASAQALAPLYGTALRGREALDALRGAVDRLNHSLANAPESTADEVKKKIAMYEELTVKAKQLIAAEEAHRRMARDAGRILRDGFENAIFSGDKLRGVVNALISDLGRMMFQSLVFGSGGTGGIWGGIKSMFAGRAHGGGVSAGNSYVVGERGPELFTPSAAGNITPNHKMDGGGAPGIVIESVDMRGASVEAVARLESFVASLHGSIENRALTAVANARSRGGARGRGLA